MRIAVVILNWNTEEYLRSFLPGVIASCNALGNGPDGSPVARTMVADSASTDGSLATLASEFSEVMTIPLDANYGFTGGYNRALENIDAEYYILLNSDIEVPVDWLKPLLEWMDTHPDCGICGPKLHALRKVGEKYVRFDEFEYAGAAGGYVDRFGYPYCRGRVLSRTEKDFGQYDKPADVLWVSGACLMIRSRVWRQLGGFDDRFFAHMEEIDLCWRAARAGYKATVVPSSVIWHLGGGTLPATSPWKLELNYRNNLLLLKRNVGSGFLIFIRMLLDGGSALVYIVSGKKDCFNAVLRAHKAYRAFKAVPIPGRVPQEYGWQKMRRICILPLAALKGENIFQYLKNYEDRH